MNLNQFLNMNAKNFPPLLHRKTGVTAFQYPFALNLNDCKKADHDWTRKLLKAIGELNDVAGILRLARGYSGSFSMSSENSLPAIGDQSLESLKRTNQHGAEFWSARDLQSLLGYNHWRSFEKAITK